MTLNKLAINKEIKALRHQMTNLEIKCQELEDKLTKLLLTLEPFVEIQTEAQKADLETKLKPV